MVIPLILLVFAGLIGWYVEPRGRALLITAAVWFAVVALLFVTWSAWEAEDEPVAFVASSLVLGAVLLGVTWVTSWLRERRSA